MGCDILKIYTQNIKRKSFCEGFSESFCKSFCEVYFERVSKVFFERFIEDFSEVFKEGFSEVFCDEFNEYEQKETEAIYIQIIKNMLDLKKTDEEIKQIIPTCTNELINKAKR